MPARSRWLHGWSKECSANGQTHLSTELQPARAEPIRGAIAFRPVVETLSTWSLLATNLPKMHPARKYIKAEVEMLSDLIVFLNADRVAK